ncbi:hypothetical protein ACFSTD_14505 [Novosphingobium colocasiae]
MFQDLEGPANDLPAMEAIVRSQGGQGRDRAAQRSGHPHQRGNRAPCTGPAIEAGGLDRVLLCRPRDRGGSGGEGHGGRRLRPVHPAGGGSIPMRRTPSGSSSTRISTPGWPGIFRRT